MTKVYYYYDATTFSYKRVERGLAFKILRAFQITLISIAGSFGLFYTYVAHFEHPGVVRLKNDIKDLEANYQALEQELNTLNQVLGLIEKRDDQVYRAVLGTEPLDKAVRNGGVGGVERHTEFREKKIKNNVLNIKQFNK